MSNHDDWSVSVVVPVYNGASYLSEALESILQQTHPPYEIILINDGSIDESEAVINQVAATTTVPIHYIYQKNQGAGAARNRGIEMATGHLIAFIDQDDLWLSEKLALQISLLRQLSTAGYSITHFEFFMDKLMRPPAWIRQYRLHGPQLGFIPSCLVVCKETFDSIGPFDSELPNGNDTDWFARANDAGIKAAVVQEVVVRHRIHDNNQSRFVLENQKDIYKIVRNALIRKRNRFPSGGH